MNRQKQMEDLLHARVKVETTDEQFPCQFPEPTSGKGAELPEEEEQHKHEPRVRLKSLSTDEDHPEKKEWISSLEQNYRPVMPNIKEEQEELRTGREEEQLQGLEEADVIRFTFIPVAVKSEEDDEEKPQSSRPHQTEEIKQESDGEDCGGPKPDKNFYIESHFKPYTHYDTSNSSEPATDDSCNWKEISGAKAGLDPQSKDEEPESDIGKTAVPSYECDPSFGHKINLQEHSGIQTGEKPFSCSLCGKKYTWKSSLTNHMRLHSEGKSISCSVCQKTFQFKRNLLLHSRVHTGEKPFSCPVCSSKFTRKDHLRDHMRIHSGEKPFSCSVCSSRFTRKQCLRGHMRIHTREKPFSCTFCNKRLTRLIYLKRHKCAGERSGNK